MPGFSASHGDFNVQGSLNEWFRVNLTANGLPTWMPSARVVFDWGVEHPLISGHSGHAFSVTHGDSRPVQTYQGNRVDGGSAGHTRQGTVEVNCWVSKQAAGNQYSLRLRQATDMVKYLFNSATEILLRDIYGATANPASLTAVVRLERPEVLAVAPDSNPDIQRTRIRVPYSWVDRS